MKAFFIESEAGPVFALYHPPQGQVLGHILFVPPFAEELNRSRHMINHMTRQFAAIGYGVLILDLYGTGDSAGDLNQATLAIWHQDILAAMGWLHGQDSVVAPPLIWAMRSGALVAASLLEKRPGLTNRIILWSPVVDGAKFITRFLRLKQAEDITGLQTARAENSTTALKEKLKQGQTVEIAGYPLSPALAADLSALSLTSLNLTPPLTVNWLELALAAPPGLAPASLNVVEQWRKAGVSVIAQAICDVAFWTLQDPEWAESYSHQTLVALTSDS